jgi:protein-L-isoaspartate(D-aspartate) O-methyltransferase
VLGIITVLIPVSETVYKAKTMKRFVIICTIAVAFIFALQHSHCTGKGESKGEASMEKLRERMVTKQIESRGINDSRVLDAMRKVKRHKFVPGIHIPSAYEDHPLPIGHGQTISQPYIVALMSELCELDGSERVLEIGTGSGYQAAVLSLLAKEVYSIEIVEPLGKSAAKKLKDYGYSNVKVRIADGYKGWPEHAPFDVIILTASPPQIPKALIEQLADNGVLVAPEGDTVQRLVKITRRGDNYQKDIITYVRFVPMVPGKN